MKHPPVSHRRHLILGRLALLTLALPPAAQAFTVCVPDTDFPPFVTHNGHDGTTIRLLQDIAADKQIPLTLEVLPRPLCLFSIKENRTDALLGAAYGPVTQDLGVFPPDPSVPPNADYALVFAESALFRRVGDNDVDFDGKLIHDTHDQGLAVQFGQPTTVEFVKNHGGQTVYTVKTFEQAFKMLLAERVDGAVLLAIPAQMAIAADPRFRDHIERVATPLANMPLYLVFSRKFFQESPGTAQMMWDGLRGAPLERKRGQ